jgi:predicted nucleic acid-binding protein
VSGVPLVVLDASVGVKWFRDERGSAEAQRLLQDQREGVVVLHVTEHFLAEVLSVVNRRLGPTAIIPAWDAVILAEIEVHPLTPELVGEAARQCVLLGCSFYDALAPALAVLLGGELCSADRRAHKAFAGVRLLGS